MDHRDRLRLVADAVELRHSHAAEPLRPDLQLTQQTAHAVASKSRSLRGALVGHFAAAEITTAPSAQRMAQALVRLDADPRCVEFFTEHIEADAVHEQIMRRDVIGSLLEQEPDLLADVVFGIQATELLEARLADHLLSSWAAGESSLRTRLRWLVSQNG
nr:iron-containing redox enzyme family protein [Lentzea indica]